MGRWHRHAPFLFYRAACIETSVIRPVRALRTFGFDGSHLGLIHATEEFNVTPRVVRCQVKVLEEWLGAPLLRRCHNQVLLIPMGRIYLQAVSEPLERITSATERVWQ